MVTYNVTANQYIVGIATKKRRLSPFDLEGKKGLGTFKNNYKNIDKLSNLDTV